MKNTIQIILILLAGTCLVLSGHAVSYAEVEPLVLPDDSLSLDSQEAQDIMNDAFERSGGIADAYTWDATGLNEFGYDPYYDYDDSYSGYYGDYAYDDYGHEDYGNFTDLGDGYWYDAEYNEVSYADGTTYNIDGDYTYNMDTGYYGDGLDDSLIYGDSYGKVETVNDPNENLWVSEDAGQPSIILPQENVDPKKLERWDMNSRYMVEWGNIEDPTKDPFMETWLPYTDENRPARPYTDIGPLYEVYSEHRDDSEPLEDFMHGGSSKSVRWMAKNASVAQGNELTQDQVADRFVDTDTVASYVGEYRLPSVGWNADRMFAENDINSFRAKATSENGVPQIGISPPGDYTYFEEDKYPRDPQRVLLHEYEHSTQIAPFEYIKESGGELSLETDPQKEKELLKELPIKIHPSGERVLPHFPEEYPPIMMDLGAIAANHRIKTGEELDATIVFPSGKEVSLPFIERTLRQKHVFTTDPETGTNHTVSELAAANPEWFDSLFGEGQGTVYMGNGDNRIDAPWWPEPVGRDGPGRWGEIKGTKEPWSSEQSDMDIYGPEVMELIADNPDASAFLAQFEKVDVVSPEEIRYDLPGAGGLPQKTANTNYSDKIELAIPINAVDAYDNYIDNPNPYLYQLPIAEEQQQIPTMTELLTGKSTLD